MSHGLSQYIIDRVYFVGVFQQQQPYDVNRGNRSGPVVVWSQYSRRRIVDTTTALRNYYEVIATHRNCSSSSSYSTVFNLEGCRWMIHTPATNKNGDEDPLLTTYVVATNPLYPLPLAAACLKDLLRLFVGEQQQHLLLHQRKKKKTVVDGRGRVVRTTRRRSSKSSQTWLSWWISCRSNHGVQCQQQSRLDDLFFTYARMSTMTTKTSGANINYNHESNSMTHCHQQRTIATGTDGLWA